MNQLDERSLLLAFKTEETKEKAFSEIIKRYQERLYWHVRRMVVNHEDANDVIQNVFVKVWRSLNDFRGESGLYTWMYRIATNESLTYLEQQKRRQSISLSSPIGEGLSMEDRLKAEDGYDANKIEWKLQKAIQSLPEKQKQVFLLRYYDEMAYDKMAEILETSAGALKASYHHAVKKIESILKAI
jgi:RNA polymerase sigma factor (sigma-70 family)